MFIIRITVLLLLSFTCLIAQGQFTVSGKVIDQNTNEMIPYATVIAENLQDSSLISASTSGLDGSFELKSPIATIRIKIEFMGYTSKVINDISFQNQKADLGNILMQTDYKALDEVAIEVERSQMEFKLDKKVFNVGSDLSSTGAGAMEVLNNVPSVNVDIEGNISLRGNTGVQILIDGKPSVAGDDQANALSSITADMIEAIEVITNPSAKYNAEGTSGIINIVLKKTDKKGLNGSMSINTGAPHNHSIGSSINLRTQKFNFFTQFGAGYRSLPSFREGRNHNLVSNDLILTDGVEYRNEYFYNIRIGSDYYLNDFNVITLSGRFAYEIENQPSETRFEIYDNDTLVSDFTRTEITNAWNPKYQFDLNYKKTFRNNEDHVLQFSTIGRFFGKDLTSDFAHEVHFGENNLNPQKTTTSFYESNYTFQLDYMNPINSFFTLETGALYTLNDVGNDFRFSNVINGSIIDDPNLTNNFMYNQKVLGVYTTGAYERKKWGLKLGLRVENTDLRTRLETTNERNHQLFTNLFPTAHTSYKFNDQFSLQAGYSKRIFRPRLWDLNPFFNIRNTFVVYAGNPGLLPEFADSYEFTGIWVLKKWSINASLYHLYTTNVTERVSVFIDNINYISPTNVGTRSKTGLEFNTKYVASNWLTLIGEGNYGQFNRTGSFSDQNFDFNGEQWNTRLITKWSLPKKWDFEWTGNYQSGFETFQGTVSGYFFMDAGLRKKLWDGKGVFNVGVRDILASRIRETFVNQRDFELYSLSFRGRFITLGFSYSFGKGEAMTYSGKR